ncbi:hypothetical protein JJJ17_15515 [Paracoccus caeni]|uniref:Uncharacterized protein n=1 Tax=Paracoccus caeni TaxID=657651 RepID=A0A934W1F3_9RHOB|nr:hypothetical protein [Paracoccus caeni]MBK4217338.1 hypothetical protein [Paracoccus caeni]
MIFKAIRGLPLACAAFGTAFIGAGVVMAQESAAERAQICVNQCLYHFGPASNPAYHACVAEMCEAPAADEAMEAPRQAPAAPRATWQNHATADGGGQSAAVDLGSHSLSYICQRGGPALLAVAGLGGSANGVSLSIDGRGLALPFIARNGVLYTAADAGSTLLAGLMGGNSVEVTGANGLRVSFPLSGSGAAIRTAMQRCGITG